VLPDAAHRVSDGHVACLDGWVAWPLGLETTEPSSSLSSKGAIDPTSSTESSVQA
jgi:hypothetical protein